MTEDLEEVKMETGLLWLNVLSPLKGVSELVCASLMK